MKEMKALPVKGLRTPRWFVYLKGAYHGRIRKTAAVNQESGLLDSAYVSEKLFLYNKTCADYMVSLERDLSSSRLEAATILTVFKIEPLEKKASAAVAIDEPMESEEESIPEGAGRGMKSCAGGATSSLNRSVVFKKRLCRLKDSIPSMNCRQARSDWQSASRLPLQQWQSTVP